MPARYLFSQAGETRDLCLYACQTCCVAVAAKSILALWVWFTYSIVYECTVVAHMNPIRILAIHQKRWEKVSNESSFQLVTVLKLRVTMISPL